MAKYSNLSPISNSSFQARILNIIINAINSIDIDALPTDDEFTQQFQSIVFSGSALANGTTYQINTLPSTVTQVQCGGGIGNTQPFISLSSNSFVCLNLTGNTSQIATFSVSGNLTASSYSGTSFQVNGSNVLTQATLPPIPAPTTRGFINIPLTTGSFLGTILIMIQANVMVMEISVTTVANVSGLVTVINRSFPNTLWQNFMSRFSDTLSGVVQDQWIAGTNSNFDDVRAIAVLSADGFQIRPINLTGNTNLNPGDRFETIITWAVDSN